MVNQVYSNQQLNELAQWFKVIGEPRRLLLLELIIQGVQCNCELGEALKMAPNLISHHLGVLREAGLVDVERDSIDARWVYYSVNPHKLEELQQFMAAYFNPERIQPRRLTCGPQAIIIDLSDRNPVS